MEAYGIVSIGAITPENGLGLFESVGLNGVITVAYNSKVEAGTTLALTPSISSKGGSITWSCAAGATKPVQANYLPANCR